MTKARTVPGESLSSRLTARGGSRARIGPQRSFYQRLGVSDPFGEEPEVDEIASSGMFSYLSASHYYRELRSQRLRMMWRLGAIRHRAVAGERLRAAGPAFAAQRTLAGASLPTLSDLVLIDPEARPGVEDQEETALPSRRPQETSRRRRHAATRAVERSAERPDAELTRALAQIESLLGGRARDAVRETIREIPSTEVAHRPEVIRELVRTVEREVAVAGGSSTVAPRSRRAQPEGSTARASRPAAMERLVDQAPTRRATEQAQRPAAVAAQRGRFAEATPLALSALRRELPRDVWQAVANHRHTVFEGPAGLEPVLRSSPAIRASHEAERAGRRPDAIERIAANVRARAAAARALPTVDRVELRHPEAAIPAEETAVPTRRPRSVDAPRRRAGPVPPEVERREPSSARVARVASRQALAPRVDSVISEVARGTEVARPRGADRVAGAVPRAASRARAGEVSEAHSAPLAVAATSWLGDVIHPERAARRALLAETPSVRSLAVARDMPLLDVHTAQSDTPEAGEIADSKRAAHPTRRRRAAGSAAVDVGAPVAAQRAERRSTATLRAATRSESDDTRLAPSPVLRRRLEQPRSPRTMALAGAALPMDIVEPRPAPSQAAEEALHAEERTRTPRAREGSVASRTSKRALQRSVEHQAVSPLVERVVPPEPAAAARPQRRTVALDLVALAPQSVAGADAPVSDVAQTPRSTRSAEARSAPATRRALHRAAEAEAMAPVRAPLTAGPARFVQPIRAQRALAESDAAESSTVRRADRAATRAVARGVRTARVDEQDRVRLVPSVTDYLDVAQGAEDIAASPVAFARAPRLVAPEQILPAVAAAPESAAETAPRARRATRRAADRLPGNRRGHGLDLHDVRDAAVRPHRGASVDPAPLARLEALARGVAVSSDPELARPMRRLDGAAAEPQRGTRRAHPVLPIDALTLPTAVASDDQEPSAVPSVRTRRSELPAVAASLRQVAGSFRAAERDQVQVLTLDAARRAAGPAPAAPTLEAILERDDEGRLVRATGRRLSGRSAGETVVLDPAELGLPAVERGAGAARSPGRRAEAPEAAPAGRRRSTAASAPTSVLARAPSAWAEERLDAAAPSTGRSVAGGSVPSPVRRAGQRWTRPVPEGPVAEGAPIAVEGAPRLTAPLARIPDGDEPVAGVGERRRPRGPRPEAIELRGEAVEDAAEVADRPERRRAHGANTWTDLSRKPGSRESEAPGWVRRAVEPAGVDRPEREPIGSRVRSGGALLSALARASDPEEVVRVILQRSHQVGALARELPGEAGSLMQAIASAPTAALDEPTVVPSRGSRGETVPSSTSRRARTSLLDGPEVGRPWRGHSERAPTSEGHEGVGVSNIMKLASKLKKLIHLAEHARRDDARSQVRMAEESALARSDGGAGKSGGQALEEDNMHFERLREEVFREVQHQLEMTKQRSMGDSDGGW